MFYQIVSVAGAVVILAAYAALQQGWLRPRSRTYSVLNFVGAGLLFWVAVVDQRMGFILVEGAWALLSVPGMIRGEPRRSTTAETAGAA